jgi:osmotically-inducible protein OsmY
MLKRKITSKILIILVFSLLYTSCSSASKTSGNAMADYGYRTAASASPQMDMSISLKYTESVTNAG